MASYSFYNFFFSFLALQLTAREMSSCSHLQLYIYIFFSYIRLLLYCCDGIQIRRMCYWRSRASSSPRQLFPLFILEKKIRPIFSCYLLWGFNLIQFHNNFYIQIIFCVLLRLQLLLLLVLVLLLFFLIIWFLLKSTNNRVTVHSGERWRILITNEPLFFTLLRHEAGFNSKDIYIYMCVCLSLCTFGKYDDIYTFNWLHKSRDEIMLINPYATTKIHLILNLLLFRSLQLHIYMKLKSHCHDTNHVICIALPANWWNTARTNRQTGWCSSVNFFATLRKQCN